jgi:MSHA biogenesis protein MshK
VFRGRWKGPVIALAALALVATSMTAQAADDELHDPFMPPGWNESSAPARTVNESAWTLQSTLTSNGRRVAIINGRAVRAGDRVGGARVLDVQRGSARLDYDGHRFTIRRSGTQVRKSRESAQ